MKIIGKYELITDLAMAGGGQCRWAFARRDGSEFFLKEFLTPTYPLPDAPGSSATKKRKLETCNQFLQHHIAIMEALNGVAASGGHLVTTRDFFRDGARFYKVTDKVDISSLSVTKVHKLDALKRLTLAATVAHSLEILHRVNLVHGDLKPANVLLKETAKKHFAAKLIDFDDAFFAGQPPPPELLIGDIAYYSPETQRYVREECNGTLLQPSSDIFALGILYNEYFAGRKPQGGGGQNAASLVLGNSAYQTGLESAWPQVDALIRGMLALKPSDRPSIKSVKSELKTLIRTTAHTGDGTDATTTESTSGTGSRLRGRLVTREKDEDLLKRSPASAQKSRLRGSLISRESKDPE